MHIQHASTYCRQCHICPRIVFKCILQLQALAASHAPKDCFIQSTCSIACLKDASHNAYGVDSSSQMPWQRVCLQAAILPTAWQAFTVSRSMWACAAWQHAPTAIGIPACSFCAKVYVEGHTECCRGKGLYLPWSSLPTTRPAPGRPGRLPGPGCRAQGCAFPGADDEVLAGESVGKHVRESPARRARHC